MDARNKVASVVAEFLGTGMLTLVFLGALQSTHTFGSLFFAALAAGAAVTVISYFFGASSGAYLNPAITLGMWTARKLRTPVAAAYIVVQMLGGWAAYGIYHYLAGSGFNPTGGHYSARILFAEAVGTFILAIAWGAAFYRRSNATNRALMLGGAFTLALLVAGLDGTIAAANPALAVGVRAFAFAGSMGWGTYVLGPVLGAIIGINLYSLLFAPGNVVAVEETVIVAETVATPAATKSRTSKATTAKKSATKKTTAKKTATTRRRR